MTFSKEHVDKQCRFLTGAMNSQNLYIDFDSLRDVKYEHYNHLLKVSKEASYVTPFWSCERDNIGWWQSSQPSVAALLQLKSKNLPRYSMVGAHRMWPMVAATLAQDDLLLEILSSRDNTYSTLAKLFGVSSEQEAKTSLYQWLFRSRPGMLASYDKIFPKTAAHMNDFSNSSEEVLSDVLKRKITFSKKGFQFSLKVSATCADLIRCIASELYDLRHVPHAILNDTFVVSKDLEAEVLEIYKRVGKPYNIQHIMVER